MWILILTVVVNYTAVSTTTTEFNSKAACEEAGGRHQVVLELEKSMRSKVVFSCSYKRGEG